MGVFKIDGIEYDVKVMIDGIERNFNALDSDKTARLLNASMFRDVIGTFYNYTLKIEPNRMKPQEYDEMYEVISSPVDFHEIEVPYAQTTLIFQAYVTSGKDTLKSMKGGVNQWGGLSINFIAKDPQRRA